MSFPLEGNIPGDKMAAVMMVVMIITIIMVVVVIVLIMAITMMLLLKTMCNQNINSNKLIMVILKVKMIR